MNTLPVYDSRRRGSRALEELRDVFQYRNLLFQLVRRDILTRYKRSVLGVAWTMLNPLGTMIILTIVFSTAFGITQQGYASYVLSGLMAWGFFSQTTTAAMLHLVWGGSLLKRIYMPRTVFAISAAGTGLVNLLLSMVPLVGVMLVTGVPIRWTIVMLPIPILFLAMFALGLGLLVSTVAIYFADVADMYQVILTAWMYLSPVIYTENFLPQQYLTWIKLFNPMFHLIKLFRAPLLGGQATTMQEWLISGGIALGTLLIGWIIFTRKSDEFAYRV